MIFVCRRGKSSTSQSGQRPKRGSRSQLGTGGFPARLCRLPWTNRKGDGYRTFNPPVADLTSAKVYTLLALQLIRTVHRGRANTAMGTWEKVLSDQDIEDVVAYLRTLRDSSVPR